eukprot:COSAG05_NODE_3222_length_2228_cov_1.934711_1_plen_86_part_10
MTEAPALELCETLRLVLEPTKASKMKGGYAAGKRINMRAVIPYIASGFKKDKIWLRRTQVRRRRRLLLYLPPPPPPAEAEAEAAAA